jgi:hypothetical protein
LNINSKAFWVSLPIALAFEERNGSAAKLGLTVATVINAAIKETDTDSKTSFKGRLIKFPENIRL